MSKKVIYTCIVGGYDQLRQPLVVDNSFDYICFTDDIAKGQVGVWKIMEIPYNDENNLRKSRYVKLLPHKALQQYDVSVWIDANIQIVHEEFYSFVNKIVVDKALIAQVPHLMSNCIYEEIRKAYYGGKVKGSDARKQFRHLSKTGFPANYGLYENNLILRRHNDESVKGISEDWWSEYCNYSERDQFSLMYVYWKHNYRPVYLIDSEHNTRNVLFLKYIYHPSVVQKLQEVSKENIVKRMVRGGYKRFFISLYLK